MYSAEAGFRSVPASEMRGVLEDLASPVLLCWDAPLTGPRLVEEAGSGDGDFSQRRLDSFFARKETGFKTPKGISRAAVRRLSPLDDLAIRSRASQGRSVGHGLRSSAVPSPAGKRTRSERRRGVATDPLLRRGDPSGGGRMALVQEGVEEEELEAGKGMEVQGFWQGRGPHRRDVGGHPRSVRRQSAEHPAQAESDDEFDAAVGYILGVKWLRGDEEVVLLGDRETGAMLLPHLKEPREPDLVENWTAFRARWTEEGGSGVAE